MTYTPPVHVGNAEGNCHLNSQTLAQQAGFTSYFNFLWLFSLVSVICFSLMTMLSYAYQKKNQLLPNMSLHEEHDEDEPHSLSRRQSLFRRPIILWDHMKLHALDTIGDGESHALL